MPCRDAMITDVITDVITASSAANIEFNTFPLHMGGIVFIAWMTTLIALKFLFKENLSVTPQMPTFSNQGLLKDKKPGTQPWASWSFSSSFMAH